MVEQITNLRILNKKSRNSGNMIFHNFIDFCKAFDRNMVWRLAQKKQSYGSWKAGKYQKSADRGDCEWIEACSS